MAIKITSTRSFMANGAKVLVHSPAGYGKTVLCSTAPRPIIISAESGLLSLADVDIPVIEVKTVNDVNDVYDWARLSNEAKNFDTLCLDSVSEIAEVLLSEFKSQFNDARQAYGMMNDEMSKMIRAFRDIRGKNVYFTAKQAMIQDDMKVTKFKASMPGKTLLRDLPFYFDIIMALKIGQLENGKTYRFLQTQPDLQYDCKDRSGKLDTIERPDLTHIFSKINGVTGGKPIVIDQETDQETGPGTENLGEVDTDSLYIEESFTDPDTGQTVIVVDDTGLDVDPQDANVEKTSDNEPDQEPDQEPDVE